VNQRERTDGFGGVAVLWIVMWVIFYFSIVCQPSCAAGKEIQKEEVNLGEPQEVEELPSWSRFPYPSERKEAEEEKSGE